MLILIAAHYENIMPIRLLCFVNCINAVLKLDLQSINRDAKNTESALASYETVQQIGIMHAYFNDLRRLGRCFKSVKYPV